MPILSDYTDQPMTDLFESLGAFFAFSNEQLKEKCQDGVEYCNLGGGMIAPVDNAKELVEGITRITKEGVAKDLAANGKEAIIRRELFNYECFYINSYQECIEPLVRYGITEDEIRQAYNKIRTTEDIDL